MLFFRFLLFLLFAPRWLFLCCCFLYFPLSLMYLFFCFLFFSFFSWVWRSTCNFIILKQDWSGILLARVEAYTPNQAKNKKWIYYMSLVSYIFFSFFLWYIHFFIFMLFTSQIWQGAKTKKIFTVILEWRLKMEQKKQKKRLKPKGKDFRWFFRQKKEYILDKWTKTVWQCSCYRIKITRVYFLCLSWWEM